ncbi:sporulation histidine kinase inhibitor Sda [Cohnella suwonensis]|uniref:Sporulation histidine kinase inhibitor Sda n=1 Tax=Cohnella suwonensis TaxID=696072 RepID=A0ABW0LZ97_9BACL
MMPSRTSYNNRERVKAMLPLLSDDLLLDAYSNALRLRLDLEFLRLLKSEIRRRRLSLPEERSI